MSTSMNKCEGQQFEDYRLFVEILLRSWPNRGSDDNWIQGVDTSAVTSVAETESDNEFFLSSASAAK